MVTKIFMLELLSALCVFGNICGNIVSESKKEMQQPNLKPQMSTSKPFCEQLIDMLIIGDLILNNVPL